MNRRIIIGGNWKMYKTPTEAFETASALRTTLGDVSAVDVVICPPAIDIPAVHQAIKGSDLKLGGQNLYWEEEGAFTGEISARMLVDAGCQYVILGHSERRHVFGETDSGINKKMKKALSSGLKPIFCVGEKLEEREAGSTQAVVGSQIKAGLAGVEFANPDDLVIAYEPVWAIGTGVNATPEQAEEVHHYIRDLLAELFGPAVAGKIRIQYGGSVKPENAKELLSKENIDGALVGGASLKPDSFAGIVNAGR